MKKRFFGLCLLLLLITFFPTLYAGNADETTGNESTSTHPGVGINSHITTPDDWQVQLEWNIDINLLVQDMDALNVPIVFDGMLMAWGRDHLRADKYVKSDAFINTYLPTMTNPPEIIGNCMFMPWNVRYHSDGTPVKPVFGIDYFSMFDPDGEDFGYVDHTTWEITAQYFYRDDPRTRALRLYDVHNGQEYETFQSLLGYYFAVYNEAESGTTSLTGTDDVNYEDINFTYYDVPQVQTAFSNYVTNTVNRYKHAVHIWSFANEPNGIWYIDPKLYAHQLAFFYSVVKAADPTATVLCASLAAGNNAVQEWWVDNFIAELISMRATSIQNGVPFPLPFDMAGLNLYVGDYGDYTLRQAFFNSFKQKLQNLASNFGVSTPPIIVKEHASEDPATSINFFYNLGAEKVLWFHHFNGPHQLVTDASNPLNTRTSYWYDLNDINNPCVPPTADAGPSKSITSGQSVIIGTPALPDHTYLWSPTTGLNNPHIAQPLASPSQSTNYTLTVTNACGSNTDSVYVQVNAPMTLSVVYPNGGETLVSGTTETIRWNWSGPTTTDVRVELHQYGIWLKDIGISRAYVGSIPWTVRNVTAETCNYTIKVITLDTPQPIYDHSDSEFCIRPQVALKPNLIVEDLAAVINEKTPDYTVLAIVKNIGNAPTPLGVPIQVSGRAGFSSIGTASLPSTLVLQPGESYSAILYNHWVPLCKTCRLRATVDPDNTINESNEDDNTLTETIRP